MIPPLIHYITLICSTSQLHHWEFLNFQIASLWENCKGRDSFFWRVRLLWHHMKYGQVLASNYSIIKTHISSFKLHMILCALYANVMHWDVFCFVLYCAWSLACVVNVQRQLVCQAFVCENTWCVSRQKSTWLYLNKD